MITTTNYINAVYSKSGDDIATLEKNVKDHPVSSLSQFLLLYHCKKNNDPRFNQLARQTVLYFNNPDWLHFQLTKSEEKEEQPEEKKELLKENNEALLPGMEPAENQSPALLETQEIIPVATNVADLPAEVEKREMIVVEEKPAILLTGDISPAEDNETVEVRVIMEEEVAFEPLHTVDYFASQGIKIKEEILANDRLGMQVKSFTDWLKSMKKLHPGRLPEQNDVIEKIIQSSAEASNADAEVLTEAMAEVLIKQDKKDKAIELYQKLSLINPAKSAYFAAKIESIKTS